MFRLPSLGNGWADCVEIWYALGDPLVTAYVAVTGGVSARAHVHTALLYLRNGSADVRTCAPLFHISETAALDALCGNLVGMQFCITSFAFYVCR